jgi:hypothetical protein
MAKGLESSPSALAMVSWNWSVPVMVRTAPPTAISGMMAGQLVRKPSKRDQRTSAPMV